MSTVFSKIIAGEIPSYKIYESERVYAFLDINPETAGHVLVVPKVEVDKVYELDDIYWRDLWGAVKKIAKHMDEVLGRRVMIKVIGTDVAHAHVHLVPFDSEWFYGRVVEMTPEEMRVKAEKLALES